MIFGAVNDIDEWTPDAGAAYIFELDDLGMWSETQKLTASDAAESDNFGHSVSISGDYAVIGAYRNDDGALQAGSAYVFEVDDAGLWTEIQKLTASVPEAIELYGETVSIEGDYIVIGATTDGVGIDAGSAYIYEQDEAGTWEEIQQIVASDGAAYDIFSKGIAISENQIMIGSYYDDDDGANSGSFYVFQRCDNLVIDIPSTELCFGEELTLSASSESGEDITWSDGITNGEAFTPSIGVNLYTATSGENDCEFEVSITVLEAPIVAITASGSILCDGEEITLSGDGATTYEWDADVVDDVSFTPPVGETTYTVVGTNDEGCEDSETIAITVNALPTVTATADATVVCDGEEITLTGSGATSYEWDEGAIDGTAFAPPLGETTYTVIGTDDNDCENSASIDIMVNALPTVTASADNTTVCEGEEITLTGGGATSYLWDEGAADGIAFEPLVGETTFTVTGTDDNDCSAMSSILINVLENPDVSIAPLEDDIFCLYEDGVTLSGTPADGTFSGTGMVGFQFDPDVAGLGTHTVYYSYENDEGCSATDSVTVTVVDCLGLDTYNQVSFKVYPNPFSDFATVKFNQELTVAHQVTIYDMLGQAVYRNENVIGSQLIITKEELGVGVYFLSLTEQNKQMLTIKLIIQ